jgi:hypothetical protein
MTNTGITEKNKKVIRTNGNIINGLLCYEEVPLTQSYKIKDRTVSGRKNSIFHIIEV